MADPPKRKREGGQVRLPSVREIDGSVLRDTVARLIVEANYNIPTDILQALRDAVESRRIAARPSEPLEQLVRNYEVAAAERRPVCQDSGVAVVMLEVGQDVHWTGGSYAGGHLRRASAKGRERAICAGR
jgi:fumarate hydratase subunit alpha